DKVPLDADLFVCFDARPLDRLGTLVDAFRGAARTLVVDHHASNTRFGDVNLIDPASPASAVLCRELLRRPGLPAAPPSSAPPGPCRSTPRSPPPSTPAWPPTPAASSTRPPPPGPTCWRPSCSPPGS